MALNIEIPKFGAVGIPAYKVKPTTAKVVPDDFFPAGICRSAILHTPTDIEPQTVRVFTCSSEHIGTILPFFDGGKQVAFRIAPGVATYLPAAIFDCPLVQLVSDSSEFIVSLILRGENKSYGQSVVCSSPCEVRHVQPTLPADRKRSHGYSVGGLRSAQLHVPLLMPTPNIRAHGWQDTAKQPPPPPVQAQTLTVLSSGEVGGVYLPLVDQVGNVVKFAVQPGTAVNLPKAIFDCLHVKFQAEEGKDFTGSIVS